MPLHDFKCHRCGREFEALVRPGAPPACECGSEELEQLPSGFAVSSATIRKANVAKARKNAEKRRVDQRHAEHEYMHKHLHDDH